MIKTNVIQMIRVFKLNEINLKLIKMIKLNKNQKKMLINVSSSLWLIEVIKII